MIQLNPRASDEKTVAERKWQQRLSGKTRMIRAPNRLRIIPAKPQLPCDEGLFGDEHLQLDLVEMLQDPED
jgi:hypothetical protein